MILLTGASGFIGRALKKRFLANGHSLLELNSENGGVTNPDLFQAMAGKEISHVFHLAGKTFVPDSWDDPAGFFSTNVAGTQNVLEFCRQQKVGLTFVSAYLYGQPGRLPISENCPIRPNNPYAQSKHLAEQLCGFYAREFGVKVNIIRPFNVYGDGQQDRFLIPTIIKQAREQATIVLKDLEPRRDYVFLEDLVDALVATLGCSEQYAVFNIGSGYSLSVREVVETVQMALGTDKPVRDEGVIRTNEISDVVADIRRARAGLGWKPRTGFSEGIQAIAAHQPALGRGPR